MSEIQIDYTSRDYSALKNELVNLVNLRTNGSWNPTDPSDLGNALLEAFAYMGDVMSYYIDRVANETQVETAIKTETLLNFASLYGYRPSGPTPATVTVSFTNDSDVPISLPVGTQVMAPLNYGPFSQAYFETTQPFTAIAPNATVSIVCVEGKTVNTDKEDYIDPVYHKPLPSSIGTSTGGANQEFQILESGIIDASLIVYVGQGVAFAPWQYVDNLVEYGPNDLVFTANQNTDGTLNVLFGDGINGAIPPASQAISATYKISVGRYGNVISGAVSEVSFIPGNIDPEAISFFTVNNATAATSGADADSQTQIRSKIKGAIISRNRAVTLNDYKYLSSLVPLVGKTNAASAVYSLVNVYLQVQNDGSATPGIISGSVTPSWTSLKRDVELYMDDKIPVGVTLNVLPPQYMPLRVEVTVLIKDTYKRSTARLDVYKALLAGDTGLFSYEKNIFGRNIPLSSVISVLSPLTGVTSVSVTKLNVDGGASAQDIVLEPNQIPYLIPANLVITVAGGINI